MYEIFYDVLSEDILYKYIFEVIFTGLLLTEIINLLLTML